MDLDTSPALPEASTEPLETPADDSGSLADHEAQFQPDAPRAANVALDEVEPEPLTKDEAQAVDKVGKFARHRAGSQRATPEDVQEINALTKELRTAEAELLKLDPKALEGSARLNVLRRQIKAVKADLAEKAPKPEPVKTDNPKPTVYAASDKFDEPEPDIEDFKDEAKYPDPVKSWMQAWSRWDRKKDAYEAKLQQTQAEQEAASAEAISRFTEKYETFAKERPDFEQVTHDIVYKTWMPDLLRNAIAKDVVNGPESVYYLAQHPDALDELILSTLEKPVNEASVAIVQRRIKQLTSSTQAANTGSAPRTPSYVPPRPPNPVRTGPIRAGNELPGDDASLAEHEKAYSRRR